MPDPDTALDGLALVTAAHYGNADGGMAVLANCDCQAVAAFLAMVCADLIERWIDPDDPEEMLASMREHYAT